MKKKGAAAQAKREGAAQAQVLFEAGTPTPLLPAHDSKTVEIDMVVRWNRVAEAAYFLAERRSFEPGRELEDWLLAEKMADTSAD